MTPPDAIRKRGIQRATTNLPEHYTVALPAGRIVSTFGAEIQAVIETIRRRNDAQSEPPAAAGSE